jgi:hypothetical protein
MAAEAKLALLLILNGRKGGGASVQVSEDLTGELLRLPTILRALADDIERAARPSIAKLKGRTP